MVLWGRGVFIQEQFYNLRLAAALLLIKIERRLQSQIVLCSVALPDWILGGCGLLAGTL